MKNIITTLIRILPLVFIISVIYLVVRLYVIYSKKVVTFNNDKIITFNSLDELTVLTVLILAVVIVLLPLFSHPNAEVIYVDKFNDEEAQTNEVANSSNLKLISEAYRKLSANLLAGEKHDSVAEKLFTGLCSLLDAGQGALYKVDNLSKQASITASYAFVRPEHQTLSYNFGEGLIGVAAKENRILKIDHIPQGYLNVFSGLGTASPSILNIIPFADETGKVVGIFEIASFSEFPDGGEAALELAKTDFLKLLNH